MTTPRSNRPLWICLAIVGYIGATLAANVTTAHYGLIPVGLGLVTTAGTYFAGLVLALRDLVHDLAGRVAAYGCIAAGALASATTAGPRLAIASGVAFVVSETVDLLVYTPLRRRGWIRAVFASNVAGAIVDTLLFLQLAGFAITGTVLAGQLTAKTTATVAFLLLSVGTRALLRHRLQPTGA
jgi:queuosine precursor transporter